MSNLLHPQHLSTHFQHFSTFFNPCFIQRSAALKTSLAVPLTVISEHLNAPQIREDGHNQPGDDILDDQNISQNHQISQIGCFIEWFLMVNDGFILTLPSLVPYEIPICWWSSYLVGVTKKIQAIWAQQHLKVSRFSFWSKAPPLPKTMLSAASAGMLQNLLRWNGEMSNFHGCNTKIS